MKKSLIVLIIIASVLTVLGVIIAGVSLAVGGFEFKNINLLGEYEIKPNEHPVFVDFEYIDITSSSENVLILPSPDGKTRVVAYETQKVYCTVEIVNNTLKVRYVDARMWFDMVGIQVDVPKVILYLPEGNYKKLTVTTSSGKIECDSNALTFENAELKSSSGKIEFSANITDTISAKTSSGGIELEDITPIFLNAHTSSGKVELSNIISGRLDTETSSGTIELEECDAQILTLKSSSGNIRGTLLSDKLFQVSIDSGAVSVPPSVNDGGTCTVTTSSGNIKLQIVK